MVVVLNPLFSSCCKLGTRGAGKFERACGLKALASDKWIGCKFLNKLETFQFKKMGKADECNLLHRFESCGPLYLRNFPQRNFWLPLIGVLQVHCGGGGLITRVLDCLQLATNIGNF